MADISPCSRRSLLHTPGSETGEALILDQRTEQEALNRLAAIQAAAEILDDHDDLSPDDRRRFLAAIQAETARLRRMITV